MWADLQSRLLQSASIKHLQEALLSGKSILLEALWETPKALLAAVTLQTTGRSVLFLTGGVHEDRLFDDLSQIAPGSVLEFPAWETLPTEEILPSPDIIGKRFETLHALANKKTPTILLCPVSAWLQKVPKPETLVPTFLHWKKGTLIPFSSLPELLTNLGYKRASVVSDKGEYALRGGILDLFPIAAKEPYRIEFFDNEIDQIRVFDPIGQKSISKTDEIFICGANELPLIEKKKDLISISDYLGENPLLMWDDLLTIENSYVALKNMSGATSSFFSSPDELQRELQKTQHIFCSEKPIHELSKIKQKNRHTIHFETLGFPFIAEQIHHQFHLIEEFFAPLGLEKGQEYKLLEHFQPDPSLSLLFITNNETEELQLKEELKEKKLPIDTLFSFGYLSSGFVVADIPLAVIPHSEITHRTRIRRQTWRISYHTPAAEFHELFPGDLVVHFHSGIGKYLGMEKHTNHLGVESDFLIIEYAEHSKLFVPLSQAYLVSRYIGAKEQLPTLSTLGSKRWQTTKAQAQTQIVGYANELLQLYAARAIEGGFHYPPDSKTVISFEQEFPYIETEDQLLAIQALKEDMISDKAMDRLICGDVGYGKTEVAMRAAFKAVIDGCKQVAVLVPTTVLAMQHYESFSERMRSFGVNIEVICRFRTPKQTKEIISRLKMGQIDIIIGTHRLLSEDISFKNLGLLIIDEEQRFGVKAKEHLKRYKANVDCLTLSATPIPRTLYMSLVQVRDMTTISTPPQDRLPIKTIIAETDLSLIQNALLREFARGGQAFYIHNRVESITERASQIQQLVPSASIGIIHGQMSADDVDVIIHRFRLGELNLLFATTIIENGIDVPNANTIFIDRADTYGLADLYQLRGRVGRWNRAAYAYFLTPKHVRLSEQAQKRLHALVESSGYGGGMKLAMRDLEIRGAGDILGLQQSGQVSAIGFHLYCKLLKKAIDSLKNKKPITFNDTKMEHAYDARLPDSYIDEVSLRMELYYRFGEASTKEELTALLEEMNDRFGSPPQEVLWLYHLACIRVFAADRHFTLLKFGTLSFIAEKQRGKETISRTIILPKKMQRPQDLETYVCEKLQDFS